MNLEEANRIGQPRWYQLYSAQRAYNMRNLLPEEWNRLVYKMAIDDDLFKKYHRYDNVLLMTNFQTSKLQYVHSKYIAKSKYKTLIALIARNCL